MILLTVCNNISIKNVIKRIKQSNCGNNLTFVLDYIVPVNGKNYTITPDERTTAGESLHIRQKFSLNSIFLQEISIIALV